MKKPLTLSLGTALMVPLLSLSVAFPSLAQGPGGRPPRDDFGPRQGGMRREGMRREGMRREGMRRERGKMQLNRMWRGIGRLERSQYPLSKAQAQKVVDLVLPWSKRPQMSETDAQTLHQRLETVLTSAQKNELESGPRGGRRGGGPGRDGESNGAGRDGFGGPPRGERPRGEDFDGPPRGGGPDERGRGGRRGGGRGGRGGGMRGGRGEGMREMRGMMKNFNLFYAPTGMATWKSLPAMAQTRLTRRYKESRATLELLSRQAKS